MASKTAAVIMQGIKKAEDGFCEFSKASPEFVEVEEAIRQSHLYLQSAEKWQVTAVQCVPNTKANKRYSEKKVELQEEFGTENTMQETYAFMELTDCVEGQCKGGKPISRGNADINCLGKSKMGIYACRHADICAYAADSTGEVKVLVCKVMLGRCHRVAPSTTKSVEALEPTPNYDCHVPSVPASVDDPPKAAFYKSLVYIYEYDRYMLIEDEPRHCLPVAVVTLKNSCAIARQACGWLGRSHSVDSNIPSQLCWPPFVASRGHPVAVSPAGHDSKRNHDLLSSEKRHTKTDRLPTIAEESALINPLVDSGKVAGGEVTATKPVRKRRYSTGDTVCDKKMRYEDKSRCSENKSNEGSAGNTSQKSHDKAMLSAVGRLRHSSGPAELATNVATIAPDVKAKETEHLNITSVQSSVICPDSASKNSSKKAVTPNLGPIVIRPTTRDPRLLHGRRSAKNMKVTQGSSPYLSQKNLYIATKSSRLPRGSPQIVACEVKCSKWLNSLTKKMIWNAPWAKTAGSSPPRQTHNSSILKEMPSNVAKELSSSQRSKRLASLHAQYKPSDTQIKVSIDQDNSGTIDVGNTLAGGSRDENNNTGQKADSDIKESPESCAGKDTASHDMRDRYVTASHDMRDRYVTASHDMRDRYVDTLKKIVEVAEEMVHLKSHDDKDSSLMKHQTSPALSGVKNRSHNKDRHVDRMTTKPTKPRVRFHRGDRMTVSPDVSFDNNQEMANVAWDCTDETGMSDTHSKPSSMVSVEATKSDVSDPALSNKPAEVHCEVLEIISTDVVEAFMDRFLDYLVDTAADDIISDSATAVSTEIAKDVYSSILVETLQNLLQVISAEVVEGVSGDAQKVVDEVSHIYSDTILDSARKSIMEDVILDGLKIVSAEALEESRAESLREAKKTFLGTAGVHVDDGRGEDMSYPEPPPSGKPTTQGRKMAYIPNAPSEEVREDRSMDNDIRTGHKVTGETTTLDGLRLSGNGFQEMESPHSVKNSQNTLLVTNEKSKAFMNANGQTSLAEFLSAAVTSSGHSSDQNIQESMSNGVLEVGRAESRGRSEWDNSDNDGMEYRMDEQQEVSSMVDDKDILQALRNDVCDILDDIVDKCVHPQELFPSSDNLELIDGVTKQVSDKKGSRKPSEQLVDQAKCQIGAIKREEAGTCDINEMCGQNKSELFSPNKDYGGTLESNTSLDNDKLTQLIIDVNCGEYLDDKSFSKDVQRPARQPDVKIEASEENLDFHPLSSSTPTPKRRAKVNCSPRSATRSLSPDIFDESSDEKEQDSGQNQARPPSEDVNIRAGNGVEDVNDMAHGAKDCMEDIICNVRDENEQDAVPNDALWDDILHGPRIPLSKHSSTGRHDLPHLPGLTRASFGKSRPVKDLLPEFSICEAADEVAVHKDVLDKEYLPSSIIKRYMESLKQTVEHLSSAANGKANKAILDMLTLHQTIMFSVVQTSPSTDPEAARDHHTNWKALKHLETTPPVSPATTDSPDKEASFILITPQSLLGPQDGAGELPGHGGQSKALCDDIISNDKDFESAGSSCPALSVQPGGDNSASQDGCSRSLLHVQHEKPPSAPVSEEEPQKPGGQRPVPECEGSLVTFLLEHESRASRLAANTSPLTCSQPPQPHPPSENSARVGTSEHSGPKLDKGYSNSGLRVATPCACSNGTTCVCASERNVSLTNMKRECTSLEENNDNVTTGNLNVPSLDLVEVTDYNHGLSQADPGELPPDSESQDQSSMDDWQQQCYPPMLLSHMPVISQVYSYFDHRLDNSNKRKRDESGHHFSAQEDMLERSRQKRLASENEVDSRNGKDRLCRESGRNRKERLYVEESRAYIKGGLHVGENRGNTKERLPVGENGGTTKERLPVGENGGTTKERLPVGENGGNTKERLQVRESGGNRKDGRRVEERSFTNTKRRVNSEGCVEGLTSTQLGPSQPKSCLRDSIQKLYETAAGEVKQHVIGKREWKAIDKQLCDLFKGYRCLHRVQQRYQQMQNSDFSHDSIQATQDALVKYQEKIEKVLNSCKVDGSVRSSVTSSPASALHVLAKCRGGIEAILTRLRRCGFAQDLLTWPQDVVIPQRTEAPLKRPLSRWQREELVHCKEAIETVKSQLLEHPAKVEKGVRTLRQLLLQRDQVISEMFIPCLP